MDHPTDIREAVRRRYAAAAIEAASASTGVTSCCGPSALDACGPAGQAVFGAALYDESEEAVLPDAVSASLGCGVPTAIADLHPGEVVLDLGSGAGADVLIAARRVTPGSKAIGLDMTPEMLELPRRNAVTAGVDNVEFVEGYLEEIPLPDGSVDVVISNCVINLAADKHVVLREAARVLRPGGRFAVSDVIADPGMDGETRADMAEWTSCIAGALTEADYRNPCPARASRTSKSSRPIACTRTPSLPSSTPATPVRPAGLDARSGRLTSFVLRLCVLVHVPVAAPRSAKLPSTERCSGSPGAGPRAAPSTPNTHAAARCDTRRTPRGPPPTPSPSRSR
jgi:arsenite methyltransferase